MTFQNPYAKIIYNENMSCYSALDRVQGEKGESLQPYPCLGYAT